jgi:hypothetical protein
MTAADITKLLAKRYKPPLYAFFPEFRNATGFDSDRAADALALGLYRSRGYFVHGFEIKVQRADWLRELKDEKKADVIGKYCDRWWVVATPGVIQPGEVPDAWGWMEASTNKLKGMKEAPTREDLPHIPRSMIASLIQRAMGGNGVVAQADVQKLKDEAFESGQSHARRTMGGAAEELASLKKQVAVFCQASGLHDLTWEGKKVGERVALLRSMEEEGVIKFGERAIRELEVWAQDIRGMLERAKKEIQ